MRFFNFALRGKEHYFFSFGIFCKKIFFFAVFIFNNNRVRGLNNCLGRTIIFFKRYYRGARIMFFKIQYVSHIRSSPAIHILVSVSNNAYIIMFARKQVYKFILNFVCILVFIYMNVFPKILIML